MRLALFQPGTSTRCGSYRAERDTDSGGFQSASGSACTSEDVSVSATTLLALNFRKQ